MLRWLVQFVWLYFLFIVSVYFRLLNFSFFHLCCATTYVGEIKLYNTEYPSLTWYIDGVVLIENLTEVWTHVVFAFTHKTETTWIIHVKRADSRLSVNKSEKKFAPSTLKVSNRKCWTCFTFLIFSPTFLHLCLLTAQVDWVGLRVGGHSALSLHSSNERVNFRNDLLIAP